MYCVTMSTVKVDIATICAGFVSVGKVAEFKT